MPVVTDCQVDSPMNLEEQVAAAFAQDGWLSRAEPHFRPRTGQTAMALAVAATIESGGVLVAEAGTGVGKTFPIWCLPCCAASAW